MDTHSHSTCVDVRGQLAGVYSLCPCGPPVIRCGGHHLCLLSPLKRSPLDSCLFCFVFSFRSGTHSQLNSSPHPSSAGFREESESTQ